MISGGHSSRRSGAVKCLLTLTNQDYSSWWTIVLSTSPPALTSNLQQQIEIPHSISTLEGFAEGPRSWKYFSIFPPLIFHHKMLLARVSDPGPFFGNSRIRFDHPDPDRQISFSVFRNYVLLSRNLDPVAAF